jgi:signal transduction histidine kinase
VRKQRKHYRRPLLLTTIPTTRFHQRASDLRELASAHLEAKQPESASEILRSALVLDPTPPEGRILLARALYQTGDFELALKWLTPLLDRALAQAEHLRGDILSDLGRTSEALDAYGLALTTNPQLDEARFSRARLWIQVNHPAQAIPELDALLQRDPTNLRALLLRAFAWMDLGEAFHALETLKNVPEEDRSIEYGLLLLRATLLAAQPTEEVDRVCSELLQKHPMDPRIRLAYARHLISLRGTDPSAGQRAMAFLEETLSIPAIDSYGNEPRAGFLTLLAEVVAEEKQEFDRAENLYRQSLSIQPDALDTLTGLGLLMLRQGRAAQAAHWFLRALFLDPGRSSTLEGFSQALCMTSDDESVTRWLGLVASGLPNLAPALISQMLRYAEEAGRTDAYEDIRREGHRMKNLLAVLGSRFGSAPASELPLEINSLYREWSGFLERIRSRPRSPAFVAPAKLVGRAIAEACDNANRVHCRIPLHLPFLQVDEQAVGSAIANVLRNALEASPNNMPVSLSVRTRENERLLEISITDQGPGIPLCDQQQIFSPGFSRKEGGSGQGLAIARRTITTHGGRIVFTSTEGGPTTFFIRLPAASWPSPVIPQEVCHGG